MVWSDSGDGSSDFSEHSSINESTPKLPNKKDIRRHPCTYKGCSFIFTRPNRLAAHLRVHTGEKPFPCTFSGCDKAYTNKSHLSRHMKSTHQTETSAKKIYSCSKCPCEFITNQNLKKHFSRTHNPELLPYWCEECQIGYKKKNRLTTHMFIHTGIKQFKCDSCEETFSSLVECNKHRRNHRTYTCFCGEVFKRWTDVLKHRKVEHVYSEYHCDTCKKVFNLKRNITRHMKIHCIPDDKEVFPCPHDCCKFYSSRYNLEHHMQSVHEGKTFNCTIAGCSAKLSTQDKLEQHIAKHSRPVTRRKQPRIRNKRKDIGKMKRSSAVKLSGFDMPIAMEKYLIEGQELPSSIIPSSTNVLDLSEY